MLNSSQMVRLLALAMFVFALSGCVTPISLDEQSPKLTYSHPKRVLVAVIDDREVVKKGKPENFIGVAHASFGIPVDWHVNQVLATEKQDKSRTLADWLGHRITHGMNKSGWEARQVTFKTLPTEKEVQELLDAEGAETLIALDLKEWYFSINLNWVSAFNFDSDTQVHVFKRTTGDVFHKQFKERDVVEESASESPQNNVLRAYRAQLEQILADPNVESLLRAWLNLPCSTSCRSLG